MSDNILFNIIIVISGFSTIILVLEATGFLPLWISKYLFRRRFANTIEMLKELGCDIEKKELIDKDTKTYSNSIQKKLEKITLNKEVEIGKSTNGNIFSEYIDLMGACANQRNAQDFARELNTFTEKISPPLEFDFIVTSKLGSPILGYEFANLVNKPLVLHSEEEKFRLIKGVDSRSKFDFGNIKIKKSKKALIVDDSTTGGRKVIDIINDLEQFGFKTTDCLVVFAPQGKNADRKLRNKGVKLHFILEIPIKKEE